MGFFDTFKGNQYKEELENLQRQYDALYELASPEIKDAQHIQQKIIELKRQQQEQQNKLDELVSRAAQMETKINEQERLIEAKKKELIVLEDDILVQEFGLYRPQFDFANALDYKEELSKIRAKQKDLIKNNMAVSGNKGWTVDGSASKGKKMVSDTQKLLLRAFNCECDELVSKVKYTNFDASLDRIYKSSEAISKLGSIMSITITQQYLDSKIKELRLAFEYQLKKQEEKEQLRAAREEQKEQAKLQRELEEERRKIEKEQTHYQSAYDRILKALERDPGNTDLISKRNEIENHLTDVNEALTNIDYRQANIKAGYVYIISNIGAFGENIYKIGMTRRLDPQDRIDELGNASVPFDFDVHAMIFSDDAPKLEAALHRAFEDKKLNLVNHRREFFYVTLDEIKRVVKNNFDKTVEFMDVPDATQFRVSTRMRNGSFPITRTAPVESSSPAQNIPNTHPSTSSAKPYSGEVLHTRWGDYEMPDPYRTCLLKGPRSDLKKL